MFNLRVDFKVVAVFSTVDIVSTTVGDVMESVDVSLRPDEVMSVAI